LKRRLDQALVDRALVRSRSQGREFIRAGLVRVGGSVCLKPGRLVSPGEDLALAAQASVHRVGRGYDKLGAFLAEHPLDFRDRFVLDGGACTGGFTQQALERGARAVLAVDSGRGQLAPALGTDPRVESREGMDLREIKVLPAPCEILLLDLTGTSLVDLLPDLAFPLAPGAHLLALVKPQYEVSARERTGGGRVKSGSSARRAVDRVLDCLWEQGWRILARQDIEPGPDQSNRETFVLAQYMDRGGHR